MFTYLLQNLISTYTDKVKDTAILITFMCVCKMLNFAKKTTKKYQRKNNSTLFSYNFQIMQ